jgi:phosphopantothenoylcysteine synthetase/decarboxylase
MTRWEQGKRVAPSPQGIAIIRERLQRMGLPITEAAARSLVEAVLAVEAPRLYAQAQGNLENSLEIIRDTAQAALTSLQEERSAPPIPAAVANDRRPLAPGRPPELTEELDDDEPRPVFKRPRR